LPLVSPPTTNSLVRHIVISGNRELNYGVVVFGHWHKLHRSFIQNFLKLQSEKDGLHRHTKTGDSNGIFFFVFRKENRVKSETKRCYKLGIRLNGVNIYA